MMFRRTRCAHCKAKFSPERMNQVVHVECVEAWAIAQAAKREREEAKRAKVQARLDRLHVKARKEAIKRIPDLIAEAQKAFNAFIRERDRDELCICCDGALGAVAGSTGGTFDCGHYRSTGSAPHLRFNEHNAHAQRKQCNRYGAGRAVDYRIGLARRIGLPAVEALEADNRVHKWERDEMRAIKATYVQKLKDLKKERE
jgi:hypothetical protein